ncbi:hypothetical protein ACFOLD_13245 [Kocuria carniphila]
MLLPGVTVLTPIVRPQADMHSALPPEAWFLAVRGPADRSQAASAGLSP